VTFSVDARSNPRLLIAVPGRNWDSPQVVAPCLPLVGYRHVPLSALYPHRNPPQPSPIIGCLVLFLSHISFRFLLGLRASTLNVYRSARPLMVHYLFALIS